jgi:hypothetical protein
MTPPALLESTLSELVASHWVIGGILVSLLWFFAGQTFSDKNKDGAVAWKCIGVFVIAILCVWTVVKHEWLGLASGLLVLYLEIWLFRSFLDIQDRK